MSLQLINRSADLRRLRDEGYNLEIRSSFLLINSIPFLTAEGNIQQGSLVCNLTLSGDTTDKPDDHQAHFMGGIPCNADGSPLHKIINNMSSRELGPGVQIHCSFSAKPHTPDGRYENYHDKVTTYIDILSGPAHAKDRSATAKVFAVIESKAEESPFVYLDTASSRAEIGAITSKLEGKKIAIVGLGGTGSYILDFVAKTSVKEIHLFDGDDFLQHNAFRSPGAASTDDLKKKEKKVIYFQNLYSRIKHGIQAHPQNLSVSNLNLLDGLDFVFLCLDKGEAKKVIIDGLEDQGVPFIDVGMGVYANDSKLGAILRVTTSTEDLRDHVVEKNRISFADGEANNEYNRNIQIADLNALNAVLAVIKWKKHMGLYFDLEREHYSTYTLDGNSIKNEDKLGN